jgi:phosphoenolpyruvate carboxylase
MSTQHPDNASVPSWSESEIIGGNAEILEAFFAYETLGCEEVMWDAEGKDVDTRVVRKLLDTKIVLERTFWAGIDFLLTEYQTQESKWRRKKLRLKRSRTSP